MMNWRHFVLTVYDRVVGHSPGLGYRPSLFSDLPLRQRRDLQVTRPTLLLRHAARHGPWYRCELAKLGMMRGDVPSIATGPPADASAAAAAPRADA